MKGRFSRVLPSLLALASLQMLSIEGCFSRLGRVDRHVKRLFPELAVAAPGKGPSSKCSLLIDSIPAGTMVEAKVRRVVDGDTFMIDPEVCIRFGIELKGRREECPVRLSGINTPEKVRSSRKEGEEYSLEAMYFLERLVEGERVYLLLGNTSDIYGRLLVLKTFLPVLLEEKGRVRYLDVHSSIVKKGLAHVFIFTLTEGNLDMEYLYCQDEARRERAGIWDTDRYKGDFHITSFHANGARADDPSIDCTGDDEPPNCEYFRIANITNRNLDLSQYSVRNCATGETIPLPVLIVPPGFMVKVYSGKGEVQPDFRKGELRVYLGREKQFWDDRGAEVIITGPHGIEDRVSSSINFFCESS